MMSANGSDTSSSPSVLCLYLMSSSPKGSAVEWDSLLELESCFYWWVREAWWLASNQEPLYNIKSYFGLCTASRLLDYKELVVPKLFCKLQRIRLILWKSEGSLTSQELFMSGDCLGVRKMLMGIPQSSFTVDMKPCIELCAERRRAHGYTYLVLWTASGKKTVWMLHFSPEFSKASGRFHGFHSHRFSEPWISRIQIEIISMVNEIKRFLLNHPSTMVSSSNCIVFTFH